MESFDTKQGLAQKTTQTKPDGFFTLGKVANRWAFLDLERKPFFSVGLNHIDPATLRYSENRSIWIEKYQNDIHQWLKKKVRKDLLAWGFNTAGWTQEVITHGMTNHRHSRCFTAEEYRALGMPYGHMLPFADFHHWEAETRYPDFFSNEFIDWCDHVAREHCLPLSDDPNLLGYWYLDCPSWTHTVNECAWKGPLFDPAKLKSQTGRDELIALATQYYKVTHDAVRRYDSGHLIFGDRYEANWHIADEVIQAAAPYVDVLTFQDFDNPVAHLAEWHKKTGKPVLLADGSGIIPVPDSSGKYKDGRHFRVDGDWWVKVLKGLRDNPGAIGAHLCGAYLRNRIRAKGLLDEYEKPDTQAIETLKKANYEMIQWIQTLTNS
jgi:hypothetical protein